MAWLGDHRGFYPGVVFTGGQISNTDGAGGWAHLSEFTDIRPGLFRLKEGAY